MCTFSIAIDDALLDSVRSSFQDEKALAEWMKEQVSIVLQNFAASHRADVVRHAHKHDALMGILKDAPEMDYRTLHLSEKYGV